MRKVGMSVSLSMAIIVRIDEHIKKHGGTFSGFVEVASAHYLDHNESVSTINALTESIKDVTNVSIKDSEQDSTPEPIDQPIDDTPKVKNNFNFDDI